MEPAVPNVVPPVLAAEPNRLLELLLPSASMVSSDAGVALDDAAPNMNGAVCWFDVGCEVPNPGKATSGFGVDPPKVNEG